MKQEMSLRNFITFCEIKKNRRDFYSQSGEDGILTWALSKLPTRSNWCVEFGAWDGKHLSNTYHLISEYGYSAVLIEQDIEKFENLKNNFADMPVVTINQAVGYSESDSLDSILAKTELPESFDLLSIDIDGNDYHVWKAFNNYRPSIVIIEINIRNKPGVYHINNPDEPFTWGVTGTSPTAMVELATEKGYSLLASVGCNLIFVKNEYVNLFYDSPVSLDEVFTYCGHSISELNANELMTFGFWV